MTQSIKDQSNRLADYITRDQIDDLMQSLFPGPFDELVVDFNKLAEEIIPDVHVMIKTHVDTLHVPGINEVSHQQVVPQTMFLYLAEAIDKYRPDWNVAQKSAMYFKYITELTKTAVQDFMQRVGDKHRREMEEIAKNVKGEEGEDGFVAMPVVHPPQADCN